jgi:peptide/nickel transport system substrate-binding protein
MAVTTLDCAFPYTQAEHFYLPCFEPLIREYADGRLEPWLATTWTLSDDMTSLTLTLREGVTFNDGSEFNAEAVKWNLEEYMTHKKAGTDTWVSVDVIDPYTVKLNLTKYYNTLITFLAGADGLMESKVAYDTYGEDWLEQNPVGTGAFKFVSLEPDVKMTFTKNPNYWGKDAQGNQLPYLDGIEYHYIADEMTRTAAVLTGEVDVTQGGGATVIYNTLQDEGWEILPGATSPMCLWPSSMNPESPWANKMVREAFDYALDREAIAKAAEGGWGDAAYQLAPEGNPAFIPDLVKKRGYDITKAKELLELAGYPNGFTTTLNAHTMADQSLLVAVQSCAEAVGITMNIERVAGGPFFEMGWVMGWEGLFVLPMTTYTNYALALSSQMGPAIADLQICCGTKRPDALYDLIDQGMSTRQMEPAKMQALMQLLWDDVTNFPVYYLPMAHAVPSYVHDMGFQTLSDFFFYTPEKGWLSAKK